MVTRWLGSLLLVTLVLLGFLRFAQAHTREAQPVLAAEHDGSHILITCTIDYAKRNSEVYFACPALGTSTDCYEGCKPTKRCPLSSSSSFENHDSTRCVPHGETVRCRKEEHANGTVTVSLIIDQRDTRLAGRWYCTHAGKASVPYTVLRQEPRTNPAPELITPSREIVAASSRETSNFRRPALVYTILSILGLSLVINMAFCVRCVLMRSYIDSVNTGDSADCIAATLCLPSELRKPTMSHKEPLLPRSAGWGTLPPLEHTGYNGSYHGSMMHQMNNPTLFMHHHAYAPAGSTAGSFRTQTGSQPRLYRPAPQADFMYNPNVENIDAFNVPSQMIYQPIDGVGGPPHGTPMSNGLPSFLRNPSIKVPSPNPSQRCYFVNNSSPPMHRVTMGADSQTQPYFVQQHPGMFGGQVVYDDVSALAVMNQASTGAAQNGAVQNYGLANATPAKGYAPFAQLYSLQHNTNNQSTGVTGAPNRNTLVDCPLGSMSANNGMVNAADDKPIMSVSSAGADG